MDTLTITPEVLSGEIDAFVIDDRSIPLVVGWNYDGTRITASELEHRDRSQPENCSHAGATWSQSLALVCPLCRQPMFLPPRLLAYLPASKITAMHELWRSAGWPEWYGQEKGWGEILDTWETLVQHPLFDHCGGIPVRLSRQQLFQNTLAEFDL
jgi:hypothetical protein